MNNLNQGLTNHFEELAQYYQSIHSYRSRNFQEVANKIKSASTAITSGAQLAQLYDRIGPSTIAEVDQYLQRGTSDRLEELKQQFGPNKRDVIKLFTGIYGVGQKTAEDMYEQGYRTIANLNGSRMRTYPFNDKQRMGYYFYYHFLQRIPREEIDLIKSQLQEIFDGYQWEIAGSYRRGTATSGDIDVIIKANPKEDFATLANKLVASELIPTIPDLGKVILAYGENKLLTAIQLPQGTARRLDVLWVAPEKYPFGLFYFTGSQYFNILMRDVAISKGWTLNEYGLYTEKGWINKYGQILENEADRITTEAEIMAVLGLPYVAPTLRNYTANELAQVKQQLRL